VQIIDGPVEARKAAREQLDHGADWIKVYMTHRSWVGKNGELVSQPTLTVEELRAIVDETHGWGKKVACHAYSGEGLQRALDGGCDSIEHGLVLTDAQIAQMIRQGTWLCATLSVYYGDWAPADTPEGRRDRKRASEHEVSFRKALQGGSEDCFWHRHGRNSMDRADRAGVSADGRIRHDADAGDPERNLAGAELLEMKGRLGVIAPGAYADVVAVAGDPWRISRSWRMSAL
jgi:imidazolonepropionase-like amidohydrolase